MKWRAGVLLTSFCIGLGAMVELTLLRRYHAMSQWLTSPTEHPNPYRIGQGSGWLSLGVVLLLGCIGVTAASLVSHRRDRVRLVASLVAAVSVLAALWVQPFSSRAFVNDRRDDVRVAALLIGATLVALFLVGWRAVAARRRPDGPVDAASRG